ncbi:MAG: 50S ribosomal protein L10 [Candidatus Woesearchaeota archaeon]
MTTAQINPQKKEAVSYVQKLLDQYSIIGVVNMEGLPTTTVQKMRSMLREKNIDLRMAKKRLLKIAFEESKKEGLKELVPHLKGMPAVICTNDNPFKLYKMLQANKSTAPAKGGQEAPKDIVVPEGPTEFAPGPIIGELGKFGIKAGIDGGKVAIKADAVVVKEGETISADLAGILTRLGIEPMEIGLDLRAAVEDGTLFTRDVLAVDEDEYISNITQSHRWAFNLAVECSIFTPETTELLISKAFTESKALALSECIVSKDVIDELLGKAHNSALSVEQQVK